MLVSGAETLVILLTEILHHWELIATITQETKNNLLFPWDFGGPLVDTRTPIPFMSVNSFLKQYFQTIAANDCSSFVNCRKMLVCLSSVHFV